MKPGKRFEQWWGHVDQGDDYRYLPWRAQKGVERLTRKAFEAGRQYEKQKEVHHVQGHQHLSLHW